MEIEYTYLSTLGHVVSELAGDVDRATRPPHQGNRVDGGAIAQPVTLWSLLQCYEGATSATTTPLDLAEGRTPNIS